MRVSTAWAQQLGVNSMLMQQAKLTETQMQLASGKKYLSPSDNVAATSNALDINVFLSVTEQYQTNSESAISRLSAEESVLAGAVDIMDRLKQLAVQGENGTLGAADRVVLGEEALQLLDTMHSLANTLGPNGDYLFGGYQAQTQPFGKTLAAAGPPAVYTFPWQGNPVPPAPSNEQRTIEIGPSRSVADGDSGYYVFGSSPISAGGTQDVFTTIQTFANNMLNNTPTTSDIDDIESAAQRFRTVRSNVGDRLNAVDDQRNINSAYVLQMQQTLSQVQDLDYTEAISRMNLQTQGLQAAQQAYVKVQGLSLFNYLR